MNKISISNMNDFQKSIWTKKYQHEDETLDSWIDRISSEDKKLKTLMEENKFLFGGRILASRGLHKLGKKITYSNCYVLEPPSDNIESIFDSAKKLARTFSYGGGVGIDLSKLRPAGSKVNNAAVTTTGAVSFMDLYNTTTDVIGQKGRRGALMLSMDVSHPDIEEFIDIKTDLNRVTKANISVKVDNEFMKAVTNKEKYKCKFLVEDTGEEIIKLIDANDLFYKLCKNNWDYAEPGLLFWDNIKNNNFLTHDKEFEYAGVNPCAEEPLPAGGSCLLGSINLSAFVKNEFTDKAYFDLEEFKEAVIISTMALNDVLDEGLELHPLEEQRKSVYNYRQIGLGVMGIADMLIKLGIKYGDDESLFLCDRLANTLLNVAVYTSATLASEHGPYPKYNKEAIKNSPMYGKLDDEVRAKVDKYGLRNSQLLTIAPTGSISNLLGVSGGIEPIFNVSYTRKTESLHDEDVYYKVYTPIVKDLMEAYKIEDECNLPDCVVTAMTVDPYNRIKMQSVWQHYIDASISSTINLHREATVNDVYNIYINAWVNGLKGVTIYRDGCKRSGILINDEDGADALDDDALDDVDLVEASTNENTSYETVCSDCGEPIVANTGGCYICLNCGNSGC